MSLKWEYHAIKRHWFAKSSVGPGLCWAITFDDRGRFLCGTSSPELLRAGGNVASTSFATIEGAEQACVDAEELLLRGVGVHALLDDIGRFLDQTDPWCCPTGGPKITTVEANAARSAFRKIRKHFTPGWVSTKDYLPPVGERVLVLSGATIYEAQLSLTERGTHFACADGGGPTGLFSGAPRFPTHWCRKPEIPE